MKIKMIALLSGLALASCTTAGSNMAAGERPATKAEIEAVAVGRTVSGAMTYAPDGGYTYKGGNRGRYRISDGSICVNFDNGQSRCDRIVTDGKSYTLVNAQGRRFPFR